MNTERTPDMNTLREVPVTGPRRRSRGQRWSDPQDHLVLSDAEMEAAQSAAAWEEAMAVKA